MKNFYEILGISKSGTQDEIKKKYKLMVHAWHPDKFPEGELRKEAEEHLKEINEAYNVLSDVEKRKLYDEKINNTQHSNSQKTASVNSTDNHDPSSDNNYCESCYQKSKTKKVAIYQIIGMIILHTIKSVKGNFCRDCIERYFYEYTATTFLLGWFGVISIIIFPFILINNLLFFISSRSLVQIKDNYSIKPAVSSQVTTILGYFSLIAVISLYFFPKGNLPTHPSIIPTITPVPTIIPTPTIAPIPTRTYSEIEQEYPPKIINGTECTNITFLDNIPIGSSVCTYGFFDGISKNKDHFTIQLIRGSRLKHTVYMWDFENKYDTSNENTNFPLDTKSSNILESNTCVFFTLLKQNTNSSDSLPYRISIVSPYQLCN